MLPVMECAEYNPASPQMTAGIDLRIGNMLKENR